jgi:hypothetical protein
MEQSEVSKMLHFGCSVFPKVLIYTIAYQPVRSVSLLVVLPNAGYLPLFPKAFLKDIVPACEIDDLANLAFISATTNNWIRAKSPETYIPQFISDHGTAIFDNQCIPLDGILLSRDSYNDFLAERRIIIPAEINRFLGIHTSSSKS